MWLIILLVMAAAAYVIAKTVLKKSDPAAGSSSGSLPPPGGTDQSPANVDRTAQIDPDAAAAQISSGAGASSGTLLASAEPTSHSASPADPEGAGSARATAGETDANVEGSTNSDALDAKATAYGVNSGDRPRDIREMIKILNLREADAARLGIEKNEFNSLASGSGTDVPPDTLASVRRQLVQWLS